MKPSDLTLFLNQVTLGLVENEALAQWLNSENAPARGQQPVWDNASIDWWMQQVMTENPEFMANA